MRAYKYESKIGTNTSVEFFIHDDGHLEFTVMPEDMTPDFMMSLMESSGNAINRLNKHGLDRIDVKRL